MLRVTLLCSSLIRRGPTNVIYNMLEAYHKDRTNIEFTIVTISPEQDESRIDEFQKFRIPILSANVTPGLKGIFFLKRLRNLILSTRPDIVHSYGFRADTLLAFMKLDGLKKISSLFNNPYDDYGMNHGKIKGWLMTKFHLALYSRFDKIIVCSEFIKSQIQSSNLPIVVIYTGVPSDYYIPLEGKLRSQRRSSMNISPEAKVFLFIGNLIPRKNPLFLINAFKALDSNNILVVMGDGELMQECKKMVNGVGNVHLIGAKPGTLHYLQIADYYISASLSEGFPTAVLEAMSVGVTPILSDIPPHREMIERFSEKCLFDNDAEYLKHTILNVTHLPSEVRDYFRKNYSADIMQKKYVMTYKELTSNR